MANNKKSKVPAGYCCPKCGSKNFTVVGNNQADGTRDALRGMAAGNAVAGPIGGAIGASVSGNNKPKVRLMCNNCGTCWERVVQTEKEKDMRNAWIVVGILIAIVVLITCCGGGALSIF